jgi:hypothetical protein
MGLFRFGLAFGVAVTCLASSLARADHQPALALDNGRGGPAIVDGYDVNGAVIEGDWGLYRPGAGAVVIYSAPELLAPTPAPDGYFPYTGRRPHYGRHEVGQPTTWQPPRPAPSYHRSWSAESPESVVTTYPPGEPPAVIEATPDRKRKHRHPRRSDR